MTKSPAVHDNPQLSPVGRGPSHTSSLPLPELIDLPGADGAIKPLVPMLRGRPCAVTLATEWPEFEKEVATKRRSQFGVAPVLGRWGTPRELLHQ